MSQEDYDEYEDIVDETEDNFDQSQDLQDAQYEQLEATFPQAKKEESIYNWFWKVVRLDNPDKSVKVGKLSKQEIGDHIISVRDALNLAYLGNIFKHKTFGQYWATRSKIISSSSMAKDGWFMDLSISQKKVRERARKKTSDGEQKWRMFKKNQNLEE